MLAATAAGAGLGAIAGGGLGTIKGLFQESQKPGGIHFTPNIEGFSDRVQGTLDKIDSTIRRNDRAAQLINKGFSVTQANQIIDREEQALNKKGK